VPRGPVDGTRILVTGASGFLGKRVVRALASQDREIHTVSRSSRADAPNHHVANLHDETAVRALMERVRPSHLVHLAWIATPGEFWESPENLTWLRTSISLIEAFHAAGGKHVVGSGSCAEYRFDGALLSETHAIGPSSLYAACKIGCSMTYESFARTHGMTFAWGRVFFVYGEGEPEQKFMTSVAGRLLRAEPAAIRDSERRLDFIHVDDVASAIAQMTLSNAAGYFNIGSGVGSRVGDVVDMIAREAGRPREQPARTGEVTPDVVATIDRARALGWTPRIPLEVGVPQLVRSLRNERETSDVPKGPRVGGSAVPRPVQP